MEQSVGALGQLDEGTEGGGLDDLGSGVAVADFGFLGHRLDAGNRVLDLGAGRSVDPDRAVVFDVDLGLELLAETADGLATLADDGADLLLVDLDRLDARRVRRKLLARTIDGFGHLVEDEKATLAGLLERVGQDLEGDTGDLDVHLEGVDAVPGTGDLEVHVTEVIFDAGDVGQDDVVIAFLDQAHGDTRDRSGHRNAGGLHRHRGGADRTHRRGAI